MRATVTALKRKVGRPRTVTIKVRPDAWDNAEIAGQVRKILESFEDVPPIDSDVRLTLQRWLYRQDKYLGGGGAGSITLVLRVFLDSDVNSGALTEPILRAVSFVSESRFARHGLALYDALDTIDLTKLAAAVRDAERDLGPVFRGSFSETLSIALRRRVLQILEPPAVKPVKVKPAPKPPISVTRIPTIEKRVQLGRELLALRMQHPCNKRYGAAVRRKFDIDAQHGVDCARVARIFGDLPAVYCRLSWDALLTLSSTPAPVRTELERRILAGERVGAPQIRRARQAHAGRQAGPCRKVGKIPSRSAARPAVKMAA